MPKVSVIVPLKNDKRVFDLLSALEKQTFKDFEVLIADDSDEKIIKDDFIKKLKLNIRYFYVKSSKVSEKIIFLSRKAKADIIAITESDCIPSERWLEDLISEYEDERTIVLGVQNLLSPYFTIFSFGSVLVPKRAFSIAFDKTIKRGEDTDWYYSLLEKGYRFKQINKGVVLHYKDPVKRLLRSFDYAKDNAYIYIKHNDGKRILKSIFFQLATIFFSFVTIVTLIIFGIFYKIKKMFFKKLR